MLGDERVQLPVVLGRHMQPSYDLIGGCRGQHMVICGQLTGCDNKPDGQSTDEA